MNQPYAQPGLVFDQTGNLYGATSHGGSNNLGTLFELSPEIGGWSFSAVYNFTDGPPIGLVTDAAGNPYGNAMGGAYDCGFVFKLTPSSGGWAFTSLYDTGQRLIDAGQKSRSGNSLGRVVGYAWKCDGPAFGAPRPRVGLLRQVGVPCRHQMLADSRGTYSIQFR